MSNRLEKQLNVVAMVKNGHKYIITFNENNFKGALDQVFRWAANAELNFTWYDAAVISQKIRIMCHN